MGEDDASPPSRANLGVRVLWITIIVLALAVFFQVGRAVTGGSGSSAVAEPQAGELSVEQAIATATRRPRAVRGFVFLREGFPPELCTGKVPEDPPRCMGPSMTITGLDPGRLDLRHGDDDGVSVSWTHEPIAILGELATSSIVVREILR